MLKRTMFLVGCLILVWASSGTVQAREKISVLDLKALNVDKVVSKILSEHIRDQIFAQGVYEVMSKEDVYAILDRMQCIQEIGAETDTRCVIDAARELGTRYMVVGTLSKLGDTYSIHLRLLDTGGDAPGVKRRVSRNCRCPEDELINTARTSADDLLLGDRDEAATRIQPMKSSPRLVPPEQRAVGKVEPSPAKKADTPRESVKTASRTPSPATTKPSPPAVSTGVESSNKGLLFINTMKDQAEAYVVSAAGHWFAPTSEDADWRPLGVTPLAPVELPAGKYWVRLRFLKGTMDEDIQAAVVKAGKTTEHLVLLEQSGLSAGGGGGL